jgi:hypothetical protein
MIKVDGHKNLFRDEETGAILNCDTLSYQKYINMREEKKKEKNEIQNLKITTNELKKEISEIKLLLKEFITNFDTKN